MMKLKNTNLNFNIKLLCFSAFITSAYFFINKLQFIAIIPILMCIYDGFIIFKNIKNRDGLKISAFLITILFLIIILHVVIVYGLASPVPIFLTFILTNLFFIYNVILHIYNRYKKLTMALLIVLWVICDSLPILMIMVLSAGLSSGISG